MNFVHYQRLLNLLAKKGRLTEPEISRYLKLDLKTTTKLLNELRSNDYIEFFNAIPNESSDQYDISLKGAEYLNKLEIESTNRFLNQRQVLFNKLLALATTIYGIAAILGYLLNHS